jgi:hypothetical protein
LYRTRCLLCVFVKTNSFGSKNVTTLETCVFFDHIAVSRCAERSLSLTKATPQACACSGQIGASCRVKRTPSSVKLGPTQRFRRAIPRAESWPRDGSSGLPLWSNQDRRSALGVRLLRPNRGLVPRQADFLFGQIRTDAALRACVYSGRIVASCRVKWASSSVKLKDRYGEPERGGVNESR